MLGLTRLFKKESREDFLGLKTVRVNGHKFIIRKINPFLDFHSEKIPQIFTYHFQRKKPAETEQKITPEYIRKSLDDMRTIVEVGVVSPKICKEILTVEDIFRWGDTGAKLYLEILAHSLNQFRGIKGVFFLIKIKRLLYTSWRKDTEKLQSN